MAGILPSATNGGVITRDLAGTCTNVGNVTNVYCPPATFVATCDLTALPNDCTARITPAQINALVSELMCLASSLSATGVWSCGSVCNLSNMFQAWSATHMLADQTTILGDGTPGSPYSVAVSPPVGVVGAAPVVVNSDPLPTDHFGAGTEYLGAPVRWIAVTFPGVTGTVLIPSYA